MSLLKKLLGKDDNFGKLMTSQFPALYLKEKNQEYRNGYITRLKKLGFNKGDANKMFDFECDVIRRHNKQFLNHPEFTGLWFFGLVRPFFQQYPQTKEDLLKEKFFTMSEICKIVDEAEWHFWNSHERPVLDGVWQEIVDWRLNGPGGEFATTYFSMIERETGIPSSCIAKLCAEQGEHLNRYKWK